MNKADTPLFSTKHPVVHEFTGSYIWGWNTRYKWLNSIIDWIYIIIHRPKLTQSNLERYDQKPK